MARLFIRSNTAVLLIVDSFEEYLYGWRGHPCKDSPPAGMSRVARLGLWPATKKCVDWQGVFASD